MSLYDTNGGRPPTLLTYMTDCDQKGQPHSKLLDSVILKCRNPPVKGHLYLPITETWQVNEI